jgi:hypothetical protein
MFICFLFHVSLEGAVFETHSMVRIVVVIGLRLFSVAHHDSCQSFLIGLYLEVTRARHVHLFPLPC